MTFTTIHHTLLNGLTRLVDALSDPRRCQRTMLGLTLAYVLAWTVYGIVSKQTQDLNADMAEMIVWTRELAWGFPKHPPFPAWVLTVWFSVFPLADWAYTLLAVTNCGLGIWIAFQLAGHWLDGEKRAAAPFLLAVIPFYNFLGLKFDQNTILITLWGLTTLALVRSLDTRSLTWAIVAGLAGAASLLTKYWSGFFLLALVIAGLLDHRRKDYFRSPAPYVTALVAAACVLPHLLWLIDNNFPPMQWVANRRASASVANWLQSTFEYGAGTVGYAGVALVFYALSARPSFAALRNALLPDDPSRRRAALLFWLPILLPIAAAAATRTNLLSLWSIPALNLLPVILLASPLVVLTREALARLAGAVIAITLAIALASPIVAGVILKFGVENDAAYARMVMAEMEREWRRTSDQPLKLIAGPFGLISTAAFYGSDKPSTFADFSPYLSPWAPGRIARQGVSIACSLDDPDLTAWCLREMDRLTVGARSTHRAEITLRRTWLGFAGPPSRFVIATVPPQP